MSKSNCASLVTIFILFALCPIKSPAEGPYDYVVTVANEQLHFVRRPELGYVVVSREEAGALETLDGTLRQFGAKDIRAVRGPGRRGISVVFSKRLASENENTIAMLRSHSRIKYAAPLFSSNEETVAIIPEIVVRLREISDDGQLQDLCQSINLRIKHRLQFTEREYLIEVLTADASGVFSTVEKLNQAEFIEWAVPNVAFSPQLLGQVIPDDTYFPNQWHLNNTGQSGGTPNADIKAPEAWEITTGDPNIVVAVLDEGVDTDHPDLVNNIVAGYDFYDDDSDPNPTGDHAHGTACAGLIAAQGNNGIGVTGVAWNCKVMPIRIIGDDGSFVTDTEIATAIRWAANSGADILSNSWGTTSGLGATHSAIQDITEPNGMGRSGKGCVVVCASGNWDPSGYVMYPAAYSESVAVGATSHFDVVWNYSGKGGELDLVAPSGRTNLQGNIWTTDIVGTAGYNNRNPSILDYTDKMGGTSGSCPIVAGVAALSLSLRPDFTDVEVKDVMYASAKDLGDPGFDTSYGFGRVDLNSALKLVKRLPLQRWIARYNGVGNGVDSPVGIAVDNSGNALVTGSSYEIGTGNSDFATVKYDPNGNELWVARYNGNGAKNDKPATIAVGNQGNVYVSGSSVGNYWDYLTIKYDSNGNQLWVARYDGGGSDEVSAMTMDDSGNLFVTGYSDGSGTFRDCFTIKYDMYGNELWAARYDGPRNHYDYGKAITVDQSGNAYVTGNSRGSDYDFDYATIKYDPNGNQSWVARYDGPANDDDSSIAVAVDNSGNVLVTGSSYGGGTGNDYATVKYDPNGNELWVARYNGSASWTDDAKGVIVDGLGNAYVTGSSRTELYGAPEHDDYITIKYDPNGNQLWLARYNGPGNFNDECGLILRDASGNLYVGGYSYGGSSTFDDYTTVKYDQNGNLLWVIRYNGSWKYNDYSTAVALDDSGNVYITGNSYESNTNKDYVTIKLTQHNYCTEAIDGDLDGNCKVDFADFVILAGNWLEVFDFNDLAILAEDWLNCNFALEEDCW